MCLFKHSNIVNKRNEINIMVEDTELYIIGITESWTTSDISDAGVIGCVMFRKDRVGRRGGGVNLYIKESTQT